MCPRWHLTPAVHAHACMHAQDERHYARHDPLVFSIHDSSENEYMSGPKRGTLNPATARPRTSLYGQVPLLEFRFVLRF